jgi:predicted RNase H-like HicB family nuclease
MKKYRYPAVFTQMEEGDVLVSFPDLNGCFSQGEDKESAMLMAKQLLPFGLSYFMGGGVKLPVPSDPADLKIKENEFVEMIECEM